MEHRLYRSRRDRVISGVCGGIADYFDIDPTVVRLIAVALAIASFGTAAIAYLVMAIVVPEEPLGIFEGSGSSVAETPEAPTQVQPYPEPGSPPAPPPPTPPSYPSEGGQPPSAHHPRRGGIWFGIVLVIIGALLLASQFAPGLDLWRLWPLIIVIIGIRILFRGGES